MIQSRRISVLRWFTLVVLMVAALAPVVRVHAQGVTTGSIAGVVTDTDKPVAGASIIAIHEPSGTTYEATTRADGRYAIQGMRVGGPYSVQAVYVGTGNAFEPKTVENITVNLGSTTDVNVNVRGIAVTENVTVTADIDPVFGSSRTGAATQVSREEIGNLPTISGRISDVTRLTPQASGNSFAGQDNRLNNITVDGSSFNNAFGLGDPAWRQNGRGADLARIHRTGAGQRRPIRRPPRQLHRRGGQHGHQKRDQSAQRLRLSPDAERKLCRHRGQGADGESRHVHVP